MSEAREMLQHELEVAQRALAEAEARFSRQEAEHQSAIKDVENTCTKIEKAHQDWLSALDAVEAPIFAHDKDLRILRCNRAYQRQAGIPFTQIIGQPYYEIFPKSHAPLPSCLRAVETPADEQDEDLTIDGTLYRSHAATIKDGQGSYLYSIHLLEDITAHKAGETKLELFRALLDRSIDAIEVIDLATLRFIDANETASRVLGYSREELLALGVQDVDPGVDQAQLKTIPDALRTDGSVVFESRHRRKDGSTFPVEVSLSRMETDREYAIAVVRDITERKRVEQAVLDERAFSNTLIRSLPGIFFLLDVEGKLVQWNQQLEELLNLSSEALLGTKALTYIHERDRPRTAQTIQQVFETGSASVEARLVLAEGIREFLLTGSRVETQNGTGLIGFGLDITARKQAEAGLRQSEVAHRTLAQNLPGMVYRVFVRERGRMEFYNEMVVQLTGYTKDELVSGTVCAIEPLMLDEDRSGVVDEVTNAMVEHRPFSVEYRLRHKNGSLRWMREHGMPVYESDDKPLYIDGVIFDITATKLADHALLQSEEKFRALVESTNDWIWEIDPQGRYTYVSPRIEALLGYQPQEVLGKTPFDLFPHREARKVGKKLKEILEKRAALVAWESINLHKDGHEVTLERSALPFFDENGEFAGYRGVDRDITERKRADALVAEQLEELRRWHDVTLGREERILELKHEVNALLGQAGQPPRYPSAESPEPKDE